MAGALVTSLVHDGAGYDSLGMAESGCPETSRNRAALGLGHLPPGVTGDNLPARLRLGYKKKLLGGSKCHAVAPQRTVVSRFSGPRAKHGAGWAKNSPGKMAVTCVQPACAVYTLETVTLGRCWHFLFYVLLFFLPPVFTIHLYSLTLFQQTCLFGPFCLKGLRLWGQATALLLL